MSWMMRARHVPGWRAQTTPPAIPAPIPNAMAPISSEKSAPRPRPISVAISPSRPRSKCTNVATRKCQSSTSSGRVSPNASGYSPCRVRKVSALTATASTAAASIRRRAKAGSEWAIRAGARVASRS